MEVDVASLRNLKWFRQPKRSSASAQDHPAPEPPDPARFTQLPTPVNARDTIATHPVTPARDPYGVRDTEQDFVIHWGEPSDG